MNVRFGHVNLVARDWRRLVAFYREAFECIPVPPERDLAGAWLDRATGITGVHIRGAHLRLPGCGEDGPTLEVFQYDSVESGAGTPPLPASHPERPGFGHLAFLVDDLEGTVDKVIALGRVVVGEPATVRLEAGPAFRFRYVRDPEENVLEIQERGDHARS